MTRHAAIDELTYIKDSFAVCEESCEALDMAIKALGPKEIGYIECAAALFKMWIDDIISEGEFDEIMDRLNDNLKKERENVPEV